ncbi:hypothetical protein MF672_024265 [Actinomadura sp. ATCC 31491]|uniref:WD40 repeat domain-containing protein n=1 Tax=Actinomadura luzonensis TaxID=2805427 RepID=A0ABT0FYB3_9ACTN|nr:hypothetical protein [Actinomadura luzonensis]MCK2216883.1 hypothetical protein [Actinomadura luzonensis]
MRRTTVLAALTAAVLAATVTPPAHAAAHAAPHAGPHHGGDSVRYASIKGCQSRDGGNRPCGGWRLVLHSGRTTTLPDAQGVALDARRRKLTYLPAPIAVSGDGQRIAYFTKAGRLAVRTLGGGVRLLPAGALPRTGQDAVTLQLSDDGSRLAAAYQGDEPHPTLVFDTATGRRLGAVPAGQTLLGFSGDGDEVLTSAEGDDTVTDLVVHDESGDQLARVTPPQVVVQNAPQALAADGRSVAVVVQGRKPELVTYDVQSDQVTGRRKITLPEGSVEMVDWTGDAQVTAHMSRATSKGTRMTIVQIDTATGAVRVRDRYTVLKDSFVFAACGG